MAEQNPPVQAVFQTVYTAIADVNIANTTTETSMFSPSMNSMEGGLTILPNSLYIGRTYQVTIRGLYSTFAVLPGNLTVRIKVGGTTVATAVATSTLLGSVTQHGFLVTFTMTARALGATGTLTTAGDLALTAATGLRQFYEVNTTGGATIDTTQARTIDVTAQWAVANAGNTITVQTATVSRLL